MAMLAAWKRKRTFAKAVRALERVASDEGVSGLRPQLLVKPFRLYEQGYVVDQYYRPPGFAWKQGLAAALRGACAAQVRTLSLEHRSLAFLVAYYGLLYRLDRFTDEEAKAVAALFLSSEFSGVKPARGELARLQETAYDLLLLQHVVQAWASLGTNGEFMLSLDFISRRDKDYAADMAVQARYQQVKPKIFTNSLTPEDIIPVAKAVERANDALSLEGSGQHRHYLGLIAAMEGKLETAMAYHANAGSTAYHTQFFRAAGQIMDAAFMRERLAKPHAYPQDITWLIKEGAGGTCSLVSCDEIYYRQYFAGFAESFSLQNPGGLLHVHGVGFAPDPAELADLAHRLGIVVNATADKANVRKMGPDYFKGYCAGARYIFLPEFLQHYERIIIHDVDGALHTDMASIWSHAHADVMLSTLVLEPGRKGHFAFWSNIGAGAFAVRATPAGVKFATMLSSYLSGLLADEREDQRYFFSDQNGLLMTTLILKDEVRLIRMPQIFSQTDSTVGPGRGKAKKLAQEAALANQRKALEVARG